MDEGPILETNAQFSVEQAQTWLSDGWTGTLSIQSGNIEKTKIGIKPDWCDGFTSKNDEVELVEVGLMVQGSFGIASEASYNDWKTTKNQKMIRSITRMVFLKHKKDARIDRFLMTIVGDKEYHDKKEGSLSNNSYLLREKHFSGYVLYHDLAGSFVNGWKYEKGKLVAKATQTSNDELNIQLKLATLCKSSTSYIVYVNCTYWSQSNNVDSTIANLVECGSPYTVAVTTTECVITGSDESAGLGNVGGGYNPPAPQPCNCTDKCPVCGKCLGSNLKSATLPDNGTANTAPLTDPCEYCTGHPEPIPDPIVDDKAIIQNPLTKCIYDKLNSSRLLQNMLKQFVGSDQYNCTLRILSNIPCYNGDQAYGNITDDNGSVTIDINSYYFGQVAPVTIAKTILHESIHANMYQKLAKIGGKDNLSNKNFEELYRSYQEATIGTPQHDFMGKYYIPSLSQALQSFDGSHFSSDYYVSLAWAGLENTAAYTNLSQLQKDEIQRKISEINAGNKNCQ